MKRPRWRELWNARSRVFPELPAIAGVITALILLVDANVHFMRPTVAVLNDLDEGYATALARRMVEGHWLPYVDGVSHRGPFFYWVYAVAVRVLGSEGWLASRWLALGSMLATLALGVAIAALLRRNLAGAVMALTYSAVCLGSMDAHDGLAMSSEHLLNVCVLAGLLCLILAISSRERPPRLVLIAVAAALTTLGGLSKQVGLVALGPYGLWVLLAAIARTHLPKKTRLWMPGAFALGVLVTFGIVVLRYAVARELGTFVYYFMTYNTRVYVGAIGPHKEELFNLFWSRKFDVLVFAAPLLGLAVAFTFSRARRLRDLPSSFDTWGAEATIATSAIVALFASNAARRDFGHYYLQVIPWGGLFGGLVLERVLERSRFAETKHWVRTALVRVSVLLPTALLAITGWTVKIREYQRVGRGMFVSAEWPICKFIASYSTPSDSIFMWGFDPAPYTACKRRSASRYVFTTFVSGYVPFFDDPRPVEDARASPHSREILLSELEREQPALIFDSPATMGNRSILQYDSLRNFLTAHYCKVNVDVAGPSPWVKKPSPECFAHRR